MPSIRINSDGQPLNFRLNSLTSLINSLNALFINVIVKKQTFPSIFRSYTEIMLSDLPEVFL